MARKRSEIDPEEMKLHQFVPYTMVALLYVGGNARKALVIERVGEMLKDQLKPADWKLMYDGPNGQGYAPIGYTGKTWPVWAGKVSYSFKFAVLAACRGEADTRQYTIVY